MATRISPVNGNAAIKKGKPSATTAAPIDYEMIARRATEIWIRKGRPPYSDVENWREAKVELGLTQDKRWQDKR